MKVEDYSKKISQMNSEQRKQLDRIRSGYRENLKNLEDNNEEKLNTLKHEYSKKQDALIKDNQSKLEIAAKKAKEAIAKSKEFFRNKNEQTQEEFRKVSKEQNLSIGLAGSLNINDIDPLIKLKPDYLGFRGALCMARKRKDDISEILLDRVISRFRFFSFQKAI